MRQLVYTRTRNLIRLLECLPLSAPHRPFSLLRVRPVAWARLGAARRDSRSYHYCTRTSITFC